MSLQHAIKFGKQLNSFKSKSEAEKYFQEYNEHYLHKIHELALKYQIELNNQPESIKVLEKWYFDLIDQDFKRFPINIQEFEICMAMYFLHVAVTNNPEAEYLVSEYPFVKGKYEFGVKLGLLTYNLARCTDHYKTPSNKRQQALYKAYKQYFKK